jgi:hypothetical protein
MKTGKRLLLMCAALLLLGWQSVTAAPESVLFDIHSRPAEDLVPQVRMLLGEDGSVAAYGNRLIVRAPAERLEEVRWLISELDRAPRNLLVEVKVDREDDRQASGADVQLNDMRANVRFHQYSTSGKGDILQRVRTIDGRPALIRIGQSVPVYQVERSRNGNDVTERLDVEYKDIQTGIYVLPRTHADNVTVEVYQQAEAMAMRPGYFDTQQANTVVSGRLGEWIPIGSIDTSGRDRGKGLGYRAGTSAANQRYLSVRVTAAGR